MLQSLLITLTICFTGSIIGSFVALVADRWPRGEGIVSPPSHCRSCGRRLRAINLVPVLSYCGQGGRCVWCRAPLPGFLVLAEIGGGAIAWVAMKRSVDLRGMAALAIFGWTLLLLALLDGRHFWLPDWVTLPLALAGLAAGGVLPEPTVTSRVAGAIVGYAALEGLRLAYRAWRGRDGLGGGDPKLLAAIGAWLGLQSLPGVVLVAALLGLGWAGLEWLRGRPSGGVVPIPLGSALAISALLWLAYEGASGLIPDTVHEAIGSDAPRKG